jgi:glyceraldehyde 3-phosphate dehydrogenase
MIRIAINGFGRIGRRVARLMDLHPEIKLVAVNDLADKHTLLHLLQYDSTHGFWQGNLSDVQFLQEQNIANLPWKDLQIDLVLECSGVNKTKAILQKHLDAGAKKVLLSAPPEQNDLDIVILGVNESDALWAETILSAGSCTTYCAAPILEVLSNHCQIEQVFINTVHSYTSDQRLQDAPHKDLRRARAAAESIIPTTTGAGKALAQVFPALVGKIQASGVRVPVKNCSLNDMSILVKEPVSTEKLKQTLQNATQEPRFKHILAYNTLPLVSTDFLGNTNACIVDDEFCLAMGNLLKVFAWYDNETGYAKRLLETALQWHK